MDLTNMEGVEGDKGPMKLQMFHEASSHYLDRDGVGGAIIHGINAALDILRQRGYLTPEAIEQLKREGM